MNLRTRLIRLAYARPELRPHLVPVLTASVVPFPSRPRKNNHTLSIGGETYVLSTYSPIHGDLTEDHDDEIGGNGARVIFNKPEDPWRTLWALNTDNRTLFGWRISDGDLKFIDKASSETGTIVRLERKGELNRVTNSQYNEIERYMADRERETLRRLEEIVEENKSSADRTVDRMTQEYFDEKVRPLLEKAYRDIAQGVVPIGFKGDSTNRFPVERQMRAFVSGVILRREFTDEKIDDYIRRNGGERALELADMQSVEWAKSDVEMKYMETALRSITSAANDVDGTPFSTVRLYWPDGRQRPMPGDQVYTTAGGLYGAAIVRGDAIKYGDRVRIKVNGKRMPASARWNVVGDPKVKERDDAAQQKREDAAATKSRIQSEAREAVETYVKRHGLKPIRSIRDVSVGETIVYVSSAGKFGDGDPDKITARMQTVTEIDGNDAVYENEYGASTNTGDITGWYRKASAGRVADRFAGTIQVPPRLLAEVQKWAVGEWSRARIQQIEKEMTSLEYVIEHNENQLTITKKNQHDILALWNEKNLHKAIDVWDQLFSLHYGMVPYWHSHFKNEMDHYGFIRHWNAGTLPDMLDKFLSVYRQTVTAVLRDDTAKWEAKQNEIDVLMRNLNGRSQKNPEKFQFNGDETKYPLLKGKTLPFTATIRYIFDANGTWDWVNKRLLIHEGIENDNEVMRVVRHELQHGMQNFISDALGHDRENVDRSVGVGPRKTRTPEYSQHGDAATHGLDEKNLHDLDDIEFHTELEDARQRLKHDLTCAAVQHRKQVLDLFVETDKFLRNLRSTPRAKAKYQLALRELGRLV